MSASSKQPMPELVAEVIDRHRELTVGQSLRVLWALKLSTLTIVALCLLTAGITIGRWTAHSVNHPAPQARDRLAINVVPFNPGLPKLSDATLDERTLEEYGKAINDRKEKLKKLSGLEKAFQENKSFYADDVGKRFEWSGTITKFAVPYRSPGRNVIAVTIKSGDHDATCLFEEQEHLGRLLSLNEGDEITVTGVLSEDGELVRCEILDSVVGTISVEVR